MHGVLLIDKPVGPTSHDVVARIRRALGERSVGHTGTLDPLASGLLPLVVGRATRIAALLSGRDKTYEAAITLGVTTDSGDAAGVRVGGDPDAIPGETAIRAALERFRGTFRQMPPAHSAKKVDGVRAYQRARRAEPVVLEPVSVTVHTLEWMGLDGPAVRLRVKATAGFYVRALARDLGESLGCGGHLSALRRTASGHLRVEDALPLEQAERLEREALSRRMLSPADALAHLPAQRVSDAGLKRVQHGNVVGPEHLHPVAAGLPPHDTGGPVRILAPDGQLVALARVRDGALHPVIVLG
jgi:tRNA pseudouridine55 synthase